MKVAIIGCGGLGNVHADSYAAMPDVTVVGVCDLDEAHARAVADKTGAQIYVDYDRMLTGSGCDIVSIALPSHLHAEFTIRAARAGKHVICEKPIALRSEDAERMVSECDQHGVGLYVGHVVRFFPEYVRVKDQIIAGQLGNIGVVHAKRSGGHPGLARPWFADDNLSGGVVVDLMIHDLDFLSWALGEVSSVYAFRQRSEWQDYATATLRFENGAIANVEAHWGYPGGFHTVLEVAGSGGTVRHDSRTSNSLTIRKAESQQEGARFAEIPQRPEALNPYAKELRHFIECIRTGGQPIVTSRDACRALELALAVMESAETGCVVYPAAFSTKGETK